MRVYASAEMTLTDTNDGISVTGIDRYYMASSSSSGITVDSQGWKSDPQETNPISRYHWSYEVVKYSDGAKIPSKPAVIGVYGKDGTTTYTWTKYADTPTSGMENSPEGKKYIGLAFNQTTQTESDNYSDYQWSLMPQNIEIGGRNLIIKENALNNTTSSSVGLSKWGYLLSDDKKSIALDLERNQNYSLSFLGYNEGVEQNVKVDIPEVVSDTKTFNITTGSNKYNWIFKTREQESEEIKVYPLQTVDNWTRYYKNSPNLVMDPTGTAYQKWSFDGIPLGNMEQVRGGMFNNTFPINGHLNGGIDTPATAWAGVNISKMYLETNDDTLLPKIIAIGDFFLNHVMDIDIWSNPLKAMPNAVTFDEVSRQWVPSTRFIHTRTFYHVAWALLEIYDVTKDTKYSNLAGQLLDGATMIQLMATSQANSNELPPYFSGAMFNAINNVGEESYEPSWDTFTNTNGDMVVRATNKWIKLFGNSTRVSFDLYAWEEKNYTVKSIADDYINHLLYLYNNQGLRKPDGHNLLYNFSHFEWEDEPHPDGYRVPVPMNWDFINEVFGKDQWFTGDLMFWAIIGFAEAGEAQIATSLLDRYYELKAPDSEGRLLFHDRYTAQGKHLINDTSKSIAFTGLYMQARNILGNHDYDAECLSALKYYQKESVFNTVDGGFSWDTEDYNSFIENKSLGEIIYSVMENASKSKPSVIISFENFIPDPVYILDIMLEKGDKHSDYTPAPEDTQSQIDKSTYNPVRYIRDWANGSTANTSNHWYEIQAIDTLGNNIALGKTVRNNAKSGLFPVVTDGNTAGTYATGEANMKAYMEVDLGSVYYNISEIKVWKYHDDGRTYYDTKTEVSEDGNNWYPIFDSKIEDEYKETSAGRTYPNTQAKSEGLLAAYHTTERLESATSKVVIDGGNITAGRIQDSEKRNYLNLDNGTFEFANGGIEYNGTTLKINKGVQFGALPDDTRTKINAGAQANTLTSAWVEPGTTQINGNNIRTGTLDAKIITTGTLSSKNNYSKINLDDGTFSFGNGRLVWDGSDMTVNGKISVSNINGDIPKSKLASAVQTEISAGVTAKSTLDSNASTWDAKETPSGAQAKATAAEANAKELASAMAFGKMLYTDPTFKYGNNSVNVYNNSGGTGVTIDRIAKQQNAPTDSTHILRVTTSTAATSPGLGGFSFQTMTSANKTYITRFIAKIPSGRSLAFASNAIGSGGNRTSKWLSSNQGTGRWEEYVYKVTAGDTGSFSSTNFFNISEGSKPLTWYIAYATVFDVTDDDLIAHKTDAWSWSGGVEIDGGKIRAETIKSNQIAAGSITADKIVMGTGTPSSGNLASGRTFSGSYSGTIPGNGNNTVGKPHASFGSGGSNNNQAESAYIQVDLGSTHQIAESRIFWFAEDRRRYYYKIKYSTNGSTWFYAVGNSNNNGWTVSKHPSSGSPGSYEPTIDHFAIPITARYLRIYGNGSTSNTDNHIYEWELYSKIQTTISGGDIVTNNLSSVSANLGTVTAGIIRSSNSRNEINLNNGNFSLGNGQITYNSSTDIVNISAKSIDLKGKVTFDAFDTQLKSTVNNKATPGDIDSAIKNIEIGGRNYFTSTSQLQVLSNVSGFVRDEKEAPNGFKLTGSENTPRGARINNVINSNGWWTVSGWFKGSQSTPRKFTIDINDLGSTTFTESAAQTWTYFECSVNVRNHSSVYNFVDIHPSEWAYYFFKDIKIEKGNKATGWSPAPENIRNDLGANGKVEIHGGNIKADTLDVGAITGDRAKFLTLSFESLNSNMKLNSGAIRIQNSDGDFATMNTIPEFRSQDSAGTAAIMGKGRSHYYSGNQNRFYIGSNLDGLPQYGVHIGKNQTWGIYRNSDSYGGTPAQYHTVVRGEHWRSITTKYWNDSTSVNVLMQLNGYNVNNYPVLQPGDVLLIKPAVAGNSSGVERIWTMGTSSDGKTTRVYSHVYHVFEGGTSGTSDRRLKHDIEPTQVEALDHIESLAFKEFKWNKDNKYEPLGLIAQDSGIIRVPDEEMEGYDIQRAIMLGLKGVQELQEIVKEQAEEIKRLKEIIDQ